MIATSTNIFCVILSAANDLYRMRRVKKTQRQRHRYIRVQVLSDRVDGSENPNRPRYGIKLYDNAYHLVPEQGGAQFRTEKGRGAVLNLYHFDDALIEHLCRCYKRLNDIATVGRFDPTTGAIRIDFPPCDELKYKLTNTRRGRKEKSPAPLILYGVGAPWVSAKSRTPEWRTSGSA